MIKIYCDGGCLKNGSKDSMSYGSYKIYNNNSLVVHEKHIPLLSKTNNQAEYDIMIEALYYLLDNIPDIADDVVIFCDSQLLVNQVSGSMKCNFPELEKRRDKLRSIISEIGAVKLTYVPRHEIVKELGH